MFRNCPNLDRLRQLRHDKQRQEADDHHASLQVCHAVRSQHQTPGVCSLPLPRALFWRGGGWGRFSVYIAIAASRQALLKVRVPDMPDLPGQPKVAGRRWRKSMHGPPAAPEEVRRASLAQSTGRLAAPPSVYRVQRTVKL